VCHFTIPRWRSLRWRSPCGSVAACELLRALFARFETLDAVPGGFAWGGTLVLRAPRTLRVVAR